jgi:hypothetical protein
MRVPDPLADPEDVTIRMAHVHLADAPWHVGRVHATVASATLGPWHRTPMSDTFKIGVTLCASMSAFLQ